MMATRPTLEAPKAIAYDQNSHTMPLQCHRHLSEDSPENISDEGTGFTDTMQSHPAIKSRRKGTRASNCLLLYQEQLISLFWEQDLPLREVQEIMKEEHGLDFRLAVTSLISFFPPCQVLNMIHSLKVYKAQFRRWGIRKNIKESEALNIAAGNGSKPIFWPDGRVDVYAARIDRHVRKYQHGRASSHAYAWKATNPSRRLRAPDVLETVESASYYMSAYFLGMYGSKHSATWFLTGPSSGEQEEFSSLFIGGLVRLSRNDQQNEAFKDINLAFESLKKLISMDHPLVYLRLVSSIAAFSQFPRSEICAAVCRTLANYLGKLSRIVHGSSHPLNHVWGESLLISAQAGPQSFALGVLANMTRGCWPCEPRISMGSFDIEKCVPSDARGLDEASLRHRLAVTASRPDMLSQAQETRLALCELLFSQIRLSEALHFFAEAKAFEAADPARAIKTLWIAELEWRGGNARASVNTLKSALSSDEFVIAGETNNRVTKKMNQEIKELLCFRQQLLATGEN